MWSWNNYIINSQPIVTSNGNAPLRPWSCIKAKIRSIVPSNGNAPSRPWRCIMAKFEIILVRMILTYCHYCVQGSHRRFLVMLQVLRSRVRLSSSRSDWFQSQIHIYSRQMNSLSLQKYQSILQPLLIKCSRQVNSISHITLKTCIQSLLDFDLKYYLMLLLMMCCASTCSRHMPCDQN